MSNLEKAQSAVRAFLADESVVLNFVATASNPYSQSSIPSDLDIYDDQNGLEYWLDPATFRILQSAPRAGFRSSGPDAHVSASVLPVPELRAKALALAERLRPGFGSRLSEFHPYEDNRRGQLFFFRWELPAPTDEELPPFLQVGLYADGALACVTDTLNA